MLGFSAGELDSFLPAVCSLCPSWQQLRGVGTGACAQTSGRGHRENVEAAGRGAPSRGFGLEPEFKSLLQQ